MNTMSWLAWIVVGAIAGYLAGVAMHSQLGLTGDIIIGIVGAFIGGFLFNLLGIGGTSGFIIWSMFVAFVGGVVLLYVLRLVTRNQGDGVRV